MEYVYDGLGRRIEKNVNGTITRYVYDLEDILFEYEGSNNTTVRYALGPGIDDLIGMERDGESYFYHTDGLESITQITDSSKQIVASYEYDAFGNITSKAGTLTNPYTYTGRQYDPESGLYYYRARYYDPKIGRFLSKDPIGFLGGINFYIYARNNPVNLIDPFGFKTWILISSGGTGGAAVGSVQAGKYYLIDPNTGRFHSWYFFGGGPSLGFWGAGYVIAGLFEAPDDPSNMSSISLAVSFFAAAGKGTAGELTGTSFWGEGEGGSGAGFAAGAGWGLGGYIIYSFWHETGCIVPLDVLFIYKGLF